MIWRTKKKKKVKKTSSRISYIYGSIKFFSSFWQKKKPDLLNDDEIKSWLQIISRSLMLRSRNESRPPRLTYWLTSCGSWVQILSRVMWPFWDDSFPPWTMDSNNIIYYKSELNIIFRTIKFHRTRHCKG